MNTSRYDKNWIPRYELFVGLATDAVSNASHYAVRRIWLGEARELGHTHDETQVVTLWGMSVPVWFKLLTLVRNLIFRYKLRKRVCNRA